MWLKSYHFPKEWPGAHYLEPSNLILDLCPGIFTERFIFRLSFAEKRLLELTWVIWSMKCEEKYGSPIRGRLHIKTTQIPPFFCCIPVFQSFLPLYIPVSFTNFSYSRKKIRRSADHLCIFICICIFFLFSCVSRVICLLILAPLKKISWKESKFKTMKRRYASDDGERGNKKLREQSCVRVVFISRIFIHTVCKGNFATQDWIETGATTRRAFF